MTIFPFNNSLFLKELWKVLVHIFSSIIRMKSLNWTFKLCLNHFVKLYKQVKNFKLIFHEEYQVTWVQSSINETNHFALEILEIGEGPHTFEWIRSNGLELLLPLGRKVVWRCLVNWQTSQWKDSTNTFVNKTGNKDFRVLNRGWPRCLCWSHIWEDDKDSQPCWRLEVCTCSVTHFLFSSCYK